MIDSPPESDIDPFCHAYLTDPYPFHQQLREAGPLVRLRSLDCWGTGRHKEMNEVLADAATYCSSAGVGIGNLKTEGHWRQPSLLLEADPPLHTQRRAVVSKVLSPANLRRLREDFEREAVLRVDAVLERGRFDGVSELAEPYILNVFPEAVGLTEHGREHLLPYGAMVFNGFGPRNAIFDECMRNAEAVQAWISTAYLRENLKPGKLGQQVYDAVDAGQIALEEAPILVRSFLSAGVDTTVNAIGNALWCFALHPGEWQKLHANPALARSAFEEVLRYESPFQSYFRTTTRDTTLAGVPIAANSKVFLSVGAANRDPLRWPDPERFDISRPTAGHMGFGGGIHGCIGQMIARLETEVLLSELARRVSNIELVGPTRPRYNNTLRGFDALPLAVGAA